MTNVRCRRTPKIIGATFNRHQWGVREGSTDPFCIRCLKPRNPKAGSLKRFKLVPKEVSDGL